jgi:Peptidase A4 family
LKLTPPVVALALGATLTVIPVHVSDRPVTNGTERIEQAPALPVIYRAQAAPSFIGYAGGTVRVSQNVIDAHYCQLQLLSRQSINIVFATNYRSCHGFRPLIRIGQNPTDAQRTISFALIAYDGYMVNRGYFQVDMAQNYVDPNPNPPHVDPPAFVPPPSAAPPPRAPKPHSGPPPAPGSVPTGMGIGEDSSSNWSGYQLTGNSFTSVTGTFNVPSLENDENCSTIESQWVGIDGAVNSNDDLIQAGVDEEPYDNFGDCEAPTFYNIYAWWEILPANQTTIDSIVASEGDSITVTIFETANPGEWDISVIDNTNGESFQTDQYYYGPGQSAEWITESSTSYVACGGQCTETGYGPAVHYGSLAYSGNLTAADADFMGQDGTWVSEPSLASDLGQLMADGFQTTYTGF